MQCNRYRLINVSSRSFSISGSNVAVDNTNCAGIANDFNCRMHRRWLLNAKRLSSMTVLSNCPFNYDFIAYPLNLSLSSSFSHTSVTLSSVKFNDWFLNLCIFEQAQFICIFCRPTSLSKHLRRFSSLHSMLTSYNFSSTTLCLCTIQLCLLLTCLDSVWVNGSVK